MVKTTIEERGRILIPKEIRDRLDLRGGEVVQVEADGDRIVITRQKNTEDFEELKGCVEESEIDPLDVKNIWAS